MKNILVSLKFNLSLKIYLVALDYRENSVANPFR